MHHDELRWTASVDPLDPGSTSFPPEAYITGKRLGWAGLEAIQFRNPPSFVISLPPMTHHTLIMSRRLPEEFGMGSPDLRRSNPAADSVVVIPAARPARCRFSDQAFV